MKNQYAPFYPGEIVTGHIEALHPLFATVKLATGYRLPLEKRFLDWQPIARISDVLSVGDCIQAVVRSKDTLTSAYNNCRTLKASIYWKGFWLDRLPLVDDPLLDFQACHPVGSVIEVQFVCYVNHYTAHVRTAEGVILELMIRDLHPAKPRNRRNFLDDIMQAPEYTQPSFGLSLLPEQCVQITIRRYDQRTILCKRLA